MSAADVIMQIMRVDRSKLREFAHKFPLLALMISLSNYLIHEKLFGQEGSGLLGVGVAFVVALIISWVLRRLSGMTWRQAFWPPREPAPWEMLPPTMESVKELAEAGLRIQAVQMYRHITGTDLQTAYDAVNAMHPK